MPTPTSSTRPHMPGYGVPAPGEDDEGMLPWSWAEERLRRSQSLWVVTVGPDSVPHAMAVWGVWIDEGFFFSTAGGSRKARNLLVNPACVVHTGDTSEPVVVWGSARVLAAGDPARPTAFEAYEAKYGISFPDPDVNPVFGVTPTWAFGIIETEEEFTRSATRWSFP